jgi:glycosyltransferase involved in cell wall biosynthesis
LVWISFLILDIHLHKTSRIEILRHLAKRGYDVYLIAVRSKERYNSKNAKIKVTPIPLRYIPVISWILFGFLTLFFVPFYLVKKKPNLIITEPSTPIFGFIWKPILSKLLGFKVILDIRSTPVTSSYRQKMQFNISVFAAKAMFDGMTTITKGMKKEVSRKFNIDPKSIGLWSDAASTELFTPEKNIRYGLELRKKFGFYNKFIFMYHGGLEYKRGIIECVKAMKIVSRKYPDVVLFLLGNGPAFHEITDLSEKIGVKNNVFVHSSVGYEEVPKYIAMSDVGVVPLLNIPIWRNQCPLKLLEYLAMKKTVIVTDIPANREIVEDKECGIYIPNSNPVTIAEAMEFAYKNKEKLKGWGELGRAIIIQKYSWDKAAEDLENYLLTICGRHVK